MAVLLLLPPLAGIWYLDRPLGQYLEFPPQTRYVAHAPFNPVVFFLLLAGVAAACYPFLRRLAAAGQVRGAGRCPSAPFPRWGWLGAVVLLVSWVLAWNRFSFFRPLQPYTFTPLWLGYILTINALTWRRSGSCLLRSHPRFFLALFPASTLFWWYFEYLNRFVQNWYYRGGGNISSLEYVVHASVCFATVLPAVLSTSELLGTSPRLAAPFAAWRPLSLPGGKASGLLLTGGAVCALACMAVFPDYLFPLVWLAPLLMIIGIRLLSGRTFILAQVEKGNWQPVVLPAAAALVCGFFWELWNWKSLAHWEYSIPFVHRYEIFAMPLLGYAGYLPFGVECLAAAQLIRELTDPERNRLPAES
jgi:hypothetical protein